MTDSISENDVSDKLASDDTPVMQIILSLVPEVVEVIIRFTWRWDKAQSVSLEY